MQTIAAGYRGLTLVVSINRDVLLVVGTLCGALFAGAWIGSLL